MICPFCKEETTIIFAQSEDLLVEICIKCGHEISKKLQEMANKKRSTSLTADKIIKKYEKTFKALSDT